MKNFIKIVIIAIILSLSFNVSSAQLSGTVTCGSGGSFSDLVSLFNYINSNGLNGDLSVRIISNQSLSTYATLNNFSGNGTYSIHIYPSGGDWTISASRGGSNSSSSTVIRLYNADNVTIDGRLDGSGTGRHLTIRNNYTSSYQACIYLYGPNSSSGCSNITIRNCNLRTGSYSASYSTGIAAVGSSFSSYGYNHDNLTIHDNYIYKCYYGMRLYASSSGRYNNTEISDNQIGSPTTSSERCYYGIYMYYNDDAVISDNNIQCASYGMYVYYNRDYVIENNTIYGGSYGIRGYYNDDFEIDNNTISGYSSYGLYIYYTYTNIDCHDNTLSGGSYGMRLYYAYDGGDVYNNHISNTSTYGMYCYQFQSASEFYNNELTGSCNSNGFYFYACNSSDFYDNYIHDITGSGTYFYAMYFSSTDNSDIYDNTIRNINKSSSQYVHGMYLSGSDGNKFLNNEISRIMCVGYNSSTYYYGAHCVRIASGNNNQFYHNIFYLHDTYSSPSSARGHSSCLLFQSTSISGTKLKNNILKNSSQGANTRAYAVYAYSANNFNDVDYNVYDVSSATNGHVGYLSGNKTTIGTWRTTTNDDDNSTDFGVTFKSNTDYHLDGTSVGAPELECPRNTLVLKDMDGEDRKSTTLMGFDEIYATVGIARDGDVVLPADPFCEGASVTLDFTAEISAFEDGVSRNAYPSFQYTWYKEGDDGYEQIVADPEKYVFDGNTFTLLDFQQEDEIEYYAVASALGSNVESSHVIPQLAPPAEITSQPQPYNVTCEGQEPVFLSISGTGDYDGYQWQKEQPDGTWLDIPGATNNYLDVDVSDDQIANGNYRCLLTGMVCDPISYISDPANIFVYNPVYNASCTVDSKNTLYLCPGDELNFTASGEGDIRGYQWQFSVDGINFNDIAPLTNSSATTPNLKLKANLSSSGFYRCNILGQTVCSPMNEPTNEIEVLVSSKTNIILEPESQVVCLGEDIMFEFLLDDAPISIQWMKDGKAIDPAHNPSAITMQLYLDNVGFDASAVYQCEIMVEDCRGIHPIWTKQVMGYVLTDPEITKQPMPVVAGAGEAAMFEVQAHVYNTSDPEKYYYQWYKGSTNNPLVNDDRITGAQASIMSITEIDPATDYANDYFVIVTGKCGATQSDNFSINAPPGISITQQPMDVQECEGIQANISVNAVPTGGGQNLTYQWFKDAMMIDGSDTRFIGFNTDLLLIDPLAVGDGGSYHVDITVQPGDITVSSDQMTLTVDPLPEIITQPMDVTVNDTRPFSLVVEAQNGSVTYQWYHNDDELVGETSSTYTNPSATFSDAGEYKCLVSNDCGDVWTDIANVTVEQYDMTGVGDPISGGFKLLTNQPNPFEGETEIQFVAPLATQARMILTDNVGRQVAVLFDGTSYVGINKVSVNAMELGLTSGVYYYTLTVKGIRLSKQMVLVK